MEKLKMLKEELIMLNNIYVKAIKDFDDKYGDSEDIEDEEDYIAIISSETAHTILSAVIESIDGLMDMEN